MWNHQKTRNHTVLAVLPRPLNQGPIHWPKSDHSAPLLAAYSNAFGKGQRDQYSQDQAQDDKAIPGSMAGTLQLFGMEDGASDGEKDQGYRDKDDEHIERGHKAVDYRQ